MNDSWAMRILNRLPLVGKVASLKRQHFKQQESILARVRALEEAADSSLDTDATLLQTCHRILQALDGMRVQTTRLAEQVEPIRRAVGVDQQADRHLTLFESMKRLAGNVSELREGQQDSQAQSEALNGDMKRLLAGLDAERDSSRNQAAGLSQDVQKLLAVVTETIRAQRSTLSQAEQIRDASDYALANPEVGLMQHLYAFLPSRVAVDVGAHVGHVAGRLLDSGYEVYAFEPCPTVYETLCKRLGTTPGFHAASIAIGPEDGERTLNLVRDTTPDKALGDPTLYSSLMRRDLLNGLECSGEVPVSMRTLDSLWRTGHLPLEVGLVKIDTEGFDLQVIFGMGDHRPPVVVAEFWDSEAAIGAGSTSNRLPDLVQEMRRRGYHWHLAMYRVDGSDAVAYFVNRGVSVPKSWGNVFFFQEHAVFAEALRWCSSMLAPTHFAEYAARPNRNETSAQTGVAVSWDLLRNGEVGLANIDYVGRWFASVLAPTLEPLGIPIEQLTTVGQGGTFPTTEFLRACGLDPTPEAWARMFSVRQLPSRAADMLLQHFSGRLVVGQIPAFLAFFLDGQDIPFLDIDIHPLRFCKDLFLRARTNDADLAERLEQCEVDESLIRRDAGLLRGRLGWHGPKIEFEQGLRVGLFIGQTEVDLSLFENGATRSPAEFVDRVRHLFQRIDHVLLMPHPYLPHADNLRPLHAAMPNSSFCGISVYSLMNHPQVELAVGLSSSVLHEAPYFGVRPEFLIHNDYWYLDEALPAVSRNFRVQVDDVVSTLAAHLAWRDHHSRGAVHRDNGGYNLRDSVNLDFGLDLKSTEGPLSLGGGESCDFRGRWPKRSLLPVGWVRGDADGVWTDGGFATIPLTTQNARRLEIDLLSPSRESIAVSVRGRGTSHELTVLEDRQTIAVDVAPGIVEIVLDSEKPVGLVSLRALT